MSSTYLKMWEKIHEATPEHLEQFLKDHPRAVGQDLEFMGETFFDVDLLESLRNAKSR